MVPTKDSKPNPLTTDLSLVESSSRSYLVNDRRSLSNTERILRQDPRTSRELERTGGLGNLLTRTGNQNLERHYLSRFVNIQTSLFIDRVTQGDILRTPTLETLFEQARENTNISTSISTALDSCCAEIQGKLDDLSQLVKDEFRRLRRLVISKVLLLEDQATSNLNTITEASKGFVRSIQDKADDHFKSLMDALLDSRQLLLTRLTRRFGILEEIINQTKTFILVRIDAISDRIESTLTRNLSVLKLYIDSSFEAQLVAIQGLLTTQGSGIASILISYYTTQVLPVLLGIGTGVSELIASTTYISMMVAKILTDLRLLPETIESLLDARFEDLKKYLSDWKSDLIKEIAQEVSLQVVGESYYKWDSISTYYPTITFLFKEQGVSQYPRKSQIKLRLSKSVGFT